MEKDRRRQAFAARFNAALKATGRAGFSDSGLVQLLARKGVGVTSATVSNWRNGKHMPKLDQIEGMAAMLEMDPGDLAFGTFRIAEPKTAYFGADERMLIDAFALLGEEERTLIRGLIRVLTARAMQQEKRPGPRKRS